MIVIPIVSHGASVFLCVSFGANPALATYDCCAASMSVMRTALECVCREDFVIICGSSIPLVTNNKRGTLHIHFTYNQAEVPNILLVRFFRFFSCIPGTAEGTGIFLSFV